ncbi:NAD(P)H-dependent flavin oxidoreductase [Marinospirillum perlucidum]|uniref:NAD(P)H-dependent flavin oxidoreductase n=1 Tax=Marinospirillum perlucidum TaxID=1982602 RepID=UPI000DF345AB|nr:nitronate monooxygenase [Marinospirillum perlucidum]
MAGSADFLHKLGCRYPVIQAPMAGVASPHLAAEVCNAGALGSLGLGASSATVAREQLVATRQLTERPFNANVFCHQPPARVLQQEEAWLNHLQPLFTETGASRPGQLSEVYTSFLEAPEQLDILLEFKPAVVSFHFGLPQEDTVRSLQKAGCLLLASITNLDEARRAEALGMDALVAQGIEAGGHRGCFYPEDEDEQLTTDALVSQVVAKMKTPVIAAGGLMTGMDIQRVLSLGAVAAQLGTAFIGCPESLASTAYRQQLLSEAASQTRLTSVVSGRPARAMSNRLIQFCEENPGPRPAAYPLAYDAAKQLAAAASQQGRNDFGVHWAGQGAPQARELPAAELIHQLVQEMHAATP